GACYLYSSKHRPRRSRKSLPDGRCRFWLGNRDRVDRSEPFPQRLRRRRVSRLSWDQFPARNPFGFGLSARKTFATSSAETVPKHSFGRVIPTHAVNAASRRRGGRTKIQ